jgi:hypothetical protein
MAFISWGDDNVVKRIRSTRTIVVRKLFVSATDKKNYGELNQIIA